MSFQRIATATVLLAGIAIGTPASADIDLEKVKLPEGFSIDVWAEVDGARSMVLGDGFVVVGTQGDEVYAVPYNQGTMKAGAVVTISGDLKVANGVSLVDGVLYIAEQPRVVRWGDKPFDPANPEQNPVQVGPDLFDDGWHGWRYSAVGPDGKLYVALGTPCNACMPEALQGRIIRMDPDGSNVEDVATGIRNSVGLAFHPESGDLYFTDNGADMMGDNVPSEELNRVRLDGDLPQNFGYPYYGGGTSRTKEFAKEPLPEGLVPPVAEFQAHTAGLGITFYQGTAFPAEYRGNLFLAQHGSWNRTFPVGYRLMRVVMNADGSVKDQEVFASGWLQRGRAWGRPVDVKQLPDGSLLVSDDEAGVIYRITYEGS